MTPDIGFAEKEALADKFADSNEGSVPLILFNERSTLAKFEAPTSKWRREPNAANIIGIVPDNEFATETFTPQIDPHASATPATSRP